MSKEKTIEYWKLMVEMLEMEAKKQKISKQKISELTGMHRSNVSRFFSLRGVPSLKTYLDIAEAMDIYVCLEAKNEL